MIYQNENQQDKYLNAVLFTKPNLNGKVFLLTKEFNDLDICYFHIIKMSASSLQNVFNMNYSVLDESNFHIDLDGKTTSFSTKPVLVKYPYVNNPANKVGSLKLTKNKEGNCYISRIDVCSNYREFGLAKTLIETTSAFAVNNGYDKITGFMLPMDKLVKKEPLKPAKVFPPISYIPNHKTEHSTLNDMESGNVLEDIYRHLGFSVKRFPDRESGILNMDLSGYEKDDNFDVLVSGLRLDEDFESDHSQYINNKFNNFKDYIVDKMQQEELKKGAHKELEISPEIEDCLLPE